MHPEDRELLIIPQQQKEQERKTSYRITRPDGSIRHVFERIFPVFDSEGHLYREVGIAHDATEVKEAEAKLIDFSRRFNNVVEDERAAIARDLHDEFGQTLAHLRQWQRIMAEALPPASLPLVDQEWFDEIVNRLGNIIRFTAHRLRPDVLDNLGLAAAIDREVKEFGRRFITIDASFRLIGKTRPINREHALVFYRVLQEALTNISRHASAKTVQVRLIFSFPTIIMTVEDDGVGFDPAKPNHFSGDDKHCGLRGITERLATIGGRARISTHKGQGTNIRVELDEGPTHTMQPAPENSRQFIA